MASQWGRKETIIWPPHQPVYTYLAALVSLLCLALFGAECFHYQSPLAKTSTLDYLRAEAGSAFDQHGKYRLFYVAGPRQARRIAVSLDFVPGTTRGPNGAVEPMALSQLATDQGYRSFYRSPATGYKDESLARWYRAAIFGGTGLLQTYLVSFYETLPILLITLFFGIRADQKRYREMKYGRVLRGPVMMTPAEFGKAHKGDGIGFKTTGRSEMMKVPAQKEAQHFQFMGDTGVGKTQLIAQVLRQIRDRNELAIVYDPAGEYIKRFFDKERGDIVLNPLDERCPSWGPANELESNAEADAIAASLYQPGPESAGKDEFFHRTPAQIFAHLLKKGPTAQQLAAWMANQEELEQRVAGTELAFYINRKAGPQSAGVLSSLGLMANCFRLLPEKAETRPEWSARNWAKDRKGWIFITSRRTHRETLRPLHSLWIDLLVMRLQDPPQDGQKKVWFVIDELASLQRLPQLHTAITENRKSMNPLVLGFQGKAQLEVLYGTLAETILSQPATKVYMKTAEPKAAKWISEAIGEIEIERVKETKFDGSRSGKNFTLDRQIESLVLSSEITGLSDRHAYLKLGNTVARFAFDYIDLPTRTQDFMPRSWPGGDLSFDPDTLKPKKPEASQIAVAGGTDQQLPKDEDSRGRPHIVHRFAASPSRESVKEDGIVAPAPQAEAPRSDEKGLTNKARKPETQSPVDAVPTNRADSMPAPETGTPKQSKAEEIAADVESIPTGTASKEDHHTKIDQTIIAEGVVSDGHHF